MSDLRQRSSSLSDPQPISATSPPPQPPPPPPPLPLPQSVLSQALESSAHLANLLPTGTLLAFQLLTPIFTKNGSCDSATRPMTLILLILLALSCFLASFTDSVRSSDGQVRYGFVTLKGLWLFDGDSAGGGLTAALDLRKYKLTFVDVAHGLLSVLVFGSVALRDKNVVSCLYPEPGLEGEEVLDIVPIGIGVICSLLFVAFPTKRHGIGYPVTPHNA